MSSILDSDRAAMVAAVRAVLADSEQASDSLSAGARRAALWQTLGAQGVTGMLAATEVGGAALGWRTAAEMFRELGYAAASGPYLDTAAVAVTALSGQGSRRAEDLLSQIADGALAVAVLFDDDSPVPYPDEIGAALVFRDGFLEIVPKPETGLDPLRSFDTEWPAADRRSLPTTGTVIGAVDAAVRDAAWDAGVLATAAMLTGITRRMLDLTRDYVRTREQFGRPIGSFQAVSHRLVDAFLALEFAVPVVDHAATMTEAAALDAGLATSKAKRAAALASQRAAHTSVQLHGAIGFTGEYALSRLIKRQLTLSRLYGDADWHTRLLTTRIWAAEE